MASRQIGRRFLSLLSKKSLPHEPLQKFYSPTKPFLILNDICKRRIVTLTEQSENPVKDVESHKPSDPCSNSSIKINTNSNLKVNPRHDLAMMFTCKKCETRSVKMMSRQSYETGVVVARCGGCSNLHLIADHLGWFGQPGCVEDFLAARGEEMKQGSTDTLNLTLEDLTGKDLEVADG